MSLELLSLRQFKCFAAADVALAPLTLLSGFNAGGKSTTLQSLLLLAQGLRTSPLSRYLPLNGSLVRLGSAGDIVRRGHRERIRFGVQGFGHSLGWELGTGAGSPATVGALLKLWEGPTGAEAELAGEDDDEESAERERLQVLQVFSGGKPLFNDRAPRLRPPVSEAAELRSAIRNLIFLSAARHSRLDVFPSPDDAEPVHADVGYEGQFAPWWYVRTADNRVRPARRRPDDSSVTVRAQVDAWLNHLFPGAAANAETVPAPGFRASYLKWVAPAPGLARPTLGLA